MNKYLLIFDPTRYWLNQVLNLFLALLLSNFGSSSLSAPTADQDTNKIAEAFNRIGRFINWIKRSIANALKSVKNKLTNQISDQSPGERINHNSWIWNEGFYPLVYFMFINLFVVKYSSFGWNQKIKNKILCCPTFLCVVTTMLLVLAIHFSFINRSMYYIFMKNTVYWIIWILFNCNKSFCHCS